MSHPQLIRHKISLYDYHRMIEVGILTEKDKVELINGEIVRMSPKGSKHSSCIQKIDHWLSRRIGENLDVRTQDPVQIPELSEPEPDLVLIPFRQDFYVNAHPLPSEVLLLIEVADSSLNLDREVKLPLYASAGIPIYWIINLKDQQIEMHKNPMGDRYGESRIARTGERIQVPILSEEIFVEDWLV